MTVVCATIGPDDTISKILPQLYRFIRIPTDEILASVARQIANIFSLIQKTHTIDANIMQFIIPPLQSLCCEEEIIVREQAVGSISRIVSKLSVELTQTHMVPLLNALSTNDWFAARYSAAHIIPVIISSLNNHYPLTKYDASASINSPDPALAAQAAAAISIKQARTSYVHLCADDTPMVRRAAALNLSEYAACFGPGALRSDPLQIIRNLSVDDREAIRSVAATQAIAMSLLCDPTDYLSIIFPLLEGLSDDCSWAVRRAIATGLPTLCSAVTPTVLAAEYLSIHMRCAYDNIHEVRLAACQALPALLNSVEKLLPHCVTNPGKAEANLLGYLDKLVIRFYRDPSPAIKTELASNLSVIAAVMGREYATSQIVPIFVALAADENAEVRTAVMTSFETVARTVGVQLVSSHLLGCISTLMIDKSWRVRRACIRSFSVLAEILGVKLFEKKMTEFVTYAFKDHNQSPRYAMCEQAASLINLFGTKWAQEKIVPIALELYSPQANYVSRVTFMTFVEQTLPEVNTEIVYKFFFPNVLMGLSDTVANVAVVACRCVIAMCKYSDVTHLKKLYSAVVEACENEDDDVRYFALNALTALNEQFSKKGEPIPSYKN